MNLSSNNISSLEGVTFPTSLTELYFDYNKISSLEGVVFPTSLTKLWLDSNQISSLEGVVFPASLIELDLRDNQIMDFSHIFPYLNQLKEFRYDKNELKTQEDLIEERVGKKRKADNL